MSETNAMGVDQLQELYGNLIEQVNAELVEVSISPDVPAPFIPHGMEGVIKFTEAKDPCIPDDLTELEGIALGKLFSFISNWCNYVQSEVTKAKCKLMVTRRQLKVMKCALETYYREVGKVPSNQVANYVVADKRYVAVDLDATFFEAYIIKADSRYGNYRRTLLLISREQTRRGEEFKDAQIKESRRMNVGQGGSKRKGVKRTW